MKLRKRFYMKDQFESENESFEEFSKKIRKSAVNFFEGTKEDYKEKSIIHFGSRNCCSTFDLENEERCYFEKFSNIVKNFAPTTYFWVNPCCSYNPKKHPSFKKMQELAKEKIPQMNILFAKYVSINDPPYGSSGRQYYLNKFLYEYVSESGKDGKFFIDSPLHLINKRRSISDLEVLSEFVEKIKNVKVEKE